MARKKKSEPAAPPQAPPRPAGTATCCSFERIVDLSGLVKSWDRPLFYPESFRGRTGRDIYAAVYAGMCSAHRFEADAKLAALGIRHLVVQGAG